MSKIQILVEGYACERCNHQWQPRKKDVVPRLCPMCKSPYYDVPRKHPKPIENDNSNNK